MGTPERTARTSAKGKLLDVENARDFGTQWIRLAFQKLKETHTFEKVSQLTIGINKLKLQRDYELKKTCASNSVFIFNHTNLFMFLLGILNYDITRLKHLIHMLSP